MWLSHEQSLCKDVVVHGYASILYSKLLHFAPTAHGPFLCCTTYVHMYVHFQNQRLQMMHIAQQQGDGIKVKPSIIIYVILLS